MFLLPKILSPKFLPGGLLLVINFQFVPCLIQETPDHVIKIALNHNFIINYLFLFIIAFRTAECFPVGVFYVLISGSPHWSVKNDCSKLCIVPKPVPGSQKVLNKCRSVLLVHCPALAIDKYEENEILCL